MKRPSKLCRSVTCTARRRTRQPVLRARDRLRKTNTIFLGVGITKLYKSLIGFSLEQREGKLPPSLTKIWVYLLRPSDHGRSHAKLPLQLIFSSWIIYFSVLLLLHISIEFLSFMFVRAHAWQGTYTRTVGAPQGEIFVGGPEGEFLGDTLVCSLRCLFQYC